ncbi:MAG: putative glycolipid-binding domain-containing protein [Nitrospirota bacterium]
MTKPIAIFLWNKVDQPGHDFCRLFKLANGWRLTGTAVFLERSEPCRLEYDVLVDQAWKTRSAKVSGHIGRKHVDVAITCVGTAGWKLMLPAASCRESSILREIRLS